VKPQQLLFAVPMFVPVIAVPLKVTDAFEFGSVELVGPFQYSTAAPTGPVMPLRVIEPVPLPRIPPTPNSATSAFETDKPVGENARLGPVLVHELPEQLVCVFTSWPVCVFELGVPLMFWF
jgi:hypothetical protein